MKIPTEHLGKYFYHFTHIHNLESIIKNGLLSTNKKNSLAIDHVNVASNSIQTRRSKMDVTCSPNGKVHDYVPFYFTTINPMLLSVMHKKNIDQPFIIFLAISIKKIIENNVVFTDSSANTSTPPNFYSDPKNLDKLNWEAINSRKWGTHDEDELHERMAEVLIWDEVPLEWIDTIIVWNKAFKDETVRLFKENKGHQPNVIFQPFCDRYFYFTKFAMGKDRDGETLITGPFFLNNRFNYIIEDVHKNREKQETFLFKDISEALEKIEADFCVIPELEGIFQLETINDVHLENVSDHTLKVVENLSDNTFYKNLSPSKKNIVKLSAFLHDIGKGPKSKWKDGKQPAYPDHPADSLKMLERILSEDIENILDEEIHQICLLVAYHDLIGDILCRGRNKEELFRIIENEQELEMLIALSLADISAINYNWYITVDSGLPNLIEEVKDNIQ